MPVPELRYALWEFFDEFDRGGGTFSTSSGPGDPWVVNDTSSGGTPTYQYVDLGETTGVFANGVARFQFSADVEVQNLCLSFGNRLAWDIDRIYGFETRLRLVGQTGAAKDAATQLAFGLASDRNDDPDSIVSHALFRLAAASTSMALTVESDDGTNDNDDIATTITMVDSEWYRFRILLTSSTDDVRFYGANANTNPAASLARLASGTTFDMSGYTAGLQPFFQLWKSSDSNIDMLEIDYCQVWGRR